MKKWLTYMASEMPTLSAGTGASLMTISGVAYLLGTAEIGPILATSSLGGFVYYSGYLGVKYKAEEGK